MYRLEPGVAVKSATQTLNGNTSVSECPGVVGDVNLVAFDEARVLMSFPLHSWDVTILVT